MAVKMWRRATGLVLRAGFGFALLSLGAQPAHAQSGDRSSVASDIVIAQGETVHNVACVACSVYVHGTVNGNIAVVMGNVEVTGTVNQKVAIVLGDLKLQQGGTIQGDVAQVGGDTELDGGTIEGRKARVPMGPIIFAMMMPLLFLAIFIWFIVWIVRRSTGPRYPYPPPPPPPGVR